MRYPPWVISYWHKASHILVLKRKWSRAKAFLLKHRGSRGSSDRYSICNEVLHMLSNIIWSGDISGLSSGPIDSLTTYLSQSWFYSNHISQQLELLHVDLLRSGLDASHEILDDFVFSLVLRFYQDRSSGVYSGTDKSCWHQWRIGSELASGICKVACGVANVDNQHWIAIAINSNQKAIFYGDSLNDGNPELVDALKWWMKIHTGADFKLFNMPITQQHDNFSCGVFALNAACAFVLPDVTLLPVDEAIIEQVQMFTQVGRRHMDNVHTYHLFYSPI
ncbi:hypothetical protein BDQ17DRAFT_1241955 [Cyathus striatus]|nr:hypothetical protein BDQ17DRAFT_1241955 [Cyathus striatus]